MVPNISLVRDGEDRAAPQLSDAFFDEEKMAKIRVYELARDLNLKNQQLIEFILKETDVKIRHFPY